MLNKETGLFHVPVTIMRGGTSKGVYILESDLPDDREKWDDVLLRMMGSPDKNQIDGLGGGQSVTSKVAIVSPSPRPDADVNYTFAQVSVDKPIVSYKGNCGNISSGVGPFAIEKGLIKVQNDKTSVRIYNTNTDKLIVADIKTSDGNVVYEGDFSIAGVPGKASPVKLKFVNPAGTLGKGLLPTGNAVDVLEVPGLGETVTQDSIDLVSRMMSMQKAHPSYAMTGAMCTAAAAVVPDSIVNQVCSEHMDTQYIRIGHPGGILECGVDFQQHNKIPEIKDTFGFRTANLIMEGVARVRF